jgi:hypothetical protein
MGANRVWGAGGAGGTDCIENALAVYARGGQRKAATFEGAIPISLRYAAEKAEALR